MAKPKSVGRLPEILVQWSPASSERMTSQCFLHEEGVGGARVHGDVVDTVATSAVGFGDVFGVEAFVDGLPGLAGVVGAEGSCGGDGDDDAVGIGGVEENGVEAEAAGSGLPVWAGFGGAEAGEFCPAGSGVGGFEEACVFSSCIHGVGVGERGLEVPDALELQGWGVPSYHWWVPGVPS